MQTRRRLPMVGDAPSVVVQTQDPPLEITLRARTEVSSFDEAKEFDWEAYEGLMIAALIIPRTVEYLADYWRSNSNMLDWAKKVRPDVYDNIRLAFTKRRKQLERGNDAGI
jgi:hypothetical protein